MTRPIVSTGRYQDIDHRFDAESGECFQVPTWRIYIAIREEDGVEWTLCHPFADTEAGAAQAQRIARRVQAKIDAQGLGALNGGQWAIRTIYGSAAYQREEPYIVEREKADALLSEFIAAAFR